MESEELFSKLRSGNPEIVVQSIEEIKEKGTTSHFSILLALLHETEDREVKKKILSLFAELKSNETVPLLMDAIQNAKYKDELKELVSCCWQNGLNYSAYLPVFVDLVIDQNFPIGFEALTVIETMYGKIDQKIIDQELKKVKEIPVTEDEQQKFLLNSLPLAISSIPETNKDFS